MDRAEDLHRGCLSILALPMGLQLSTTERCHPSGSCGRCINPAAPVIPSRRGRIAGWRLYLLICLAWVGPRRFYITQSIALLTIAQIQRIHDMEDSRVDLSRDVARRPCRILHYFRIPLCFFFSSMHLASISPCFGQRKKEL